ncbi:hypothetical protein [Capnocytophaga canimorsus]|uniref:hypothetical protein n=1 Tax=Capnocytophaga canimorsus TaxID=28188 RepID=UPI000F5049B7|nr:hypothetical protein [Capnocytophaga canimorsus]AYW36858.1 hypothetical protein D8L92_05785 [Capnocytophaga canimorsus]MDT9499553.1 hypothetical protein [Capnocytophaga canimorsus]GIM55804.1 hypothetical protein CAPN006_01980 [Capnocytophaga canimorsus]
MKKFLFSALALSFGVVAYGNTITLEGKEAEKVIIEVKTYNQECLEYARNAVRHEYSQCGGINTREQFEEAFWWYYDVCDEFGAENTLLPICVEQ